MNTKSINNFMPSKYHISFTIFITQEFGPMEDFFKQHFAQHKIQTEMHGGVFNFGSDIHFANIFEVTKLDPMQFIGFTHLWMKKNIFNTIFETKLVDFETLSNLLWKDYRKKSSKEVEEDSKRLSNILERFSCSNIVSRFKRVFTNFF